MSRRRRIRVLLVEDHQVMADALSGALATHDEIDIVGSVRRISEATEHVERQPPDVVLMDVGLPDGDGAAATAEILGIAPNVKVVIFSGATGIEVIARAVDAGAVGFVAKTEPLEVLTSAVLRVHKGEALFSVETLSEVAGHMRRSLRRPGRELTPREREVLELMAAGTASDEIASTLVLSIHTVRNHIRNVMGKLQAHTKLEAVAVATRERLIEPPVRDPGSGAGERGLRRRDS